MTTEGMVQRAVEIEPLEAIAPLRSEQETFARIIPNKLTSERMSLPQRQIRTKSKLMGAAGVDTLVIDIMIREGCRLPLTLVSKGLG